MSDKFLTVILNMLKNSQMSISSVSRELKTNGYDLHRLIITGYLRALHDTGYLEEKEIPPSKVFTARLSGAFKIILAAAATTIFAMLPLYFMGLGALGGFAMVTIVGVLLGVLVTRPAYGRIIRVI